MTNKTHIYFVPGLAASSSIFEYLELPQDRFEIHYLDWLVPQSQSENISNYAKRMCDKILHENPVLIGVSFGGIMVQEMSKIISTKKTIIISSVKSKKELPKRLRVAKATKAYKLFPTKAIVNLENFAKYAFGDVAKKRVDLYKKYLTMRDEIYLPWAVYNVLYWQQEDPLPKIVHIHGNNDGVFPIKHISNCTVVEGGTHVMILNKAKQISKLLIAII
jgi:pimeloyl-ACP methyl ester carboxylesterase